MIPYHRSIITEKEIEAVAETLRSGWLTAGKRVIEFEEAFSKRKEDQTAIAVSSCTAALFLLLNSLDLEPGDQVITTPFTYVATANTILQNNGKVVFADINPETMNINPDAVLAAITARTRAVVCVHLGGNPCEMNKLVEICQSKGIVLIEDCAHAIEGTYGGKALGTFGYGSAFSFYPTKNITAAEGGMIVLPKSSNELFSRLSRLRRHGVDFNAWQRESEKEYHFYDVSEPGFKMNMTDVQASLGIQQLSHIEEWYKRRKQIADTYNLAFLQIPGVILQKHEPGGEHALHLYIIRLDKKVFGERRNQILQTIQESGVQISVNYPPIHLFSWFTEKLRYRKGDFPHAELCGETCFSLPFYPGLTESEVEKIIAVVSGILQS